MKNEPRIESRPARPYVGTRAVMAMSAFDREIPAMTEKVLEWLVSQGLRPSGEPFLRYHVIDMPDRMDVELGIPVEHVSEAIAPLENDVLPAGRYAVLTYKGVKNGIAANKRLIDWIIEQKEEMASHDSPDGQAFQSRYETFLTDAVAQPDRDEWETEVAIKLLD